MEADRIDSLLESYLHLLDEYTTLRSTLASLQGAMFQNIARANFSAERGVRYGQDFYDERMQATRRVTVDVTGENANVPAFSVVDQAASILEHCDTSEGKALEVEDAEQSGGSPASGGKSDPPKEQIEVDATETRPKKDSRRNPLRWFGLITPMPLRFAQGQAIQIVETVVPRLATINAEMLDIEIEVRRARKRRAKAETEAAKRKSTNAGRASPVQLEAP
ncbi:hypothetical protein jhhlp_002067 [Lomentospora prolificans]|uniref:Vacuolar ATPase assembly protein VMA22 n=1 Tax=Lomentospora prolificans TaxID=41688 RepID=A0A2N3NCX6_9PEZI|nr:hypothetical protein jhhlp_002067 [Lomentospora prolificans]